MNHKEECKKMEENLRENQFKYLFDESYKKRIDELRVDMVPKVFKFIELLSGDSFRVLPIIKVRVNKAKKETEKKNYEDFECYIENGGNKPSSRTVGYGVTESVTQCGGVDLSKLNEHIDIDIYREHNGIFYPDTGMMDFGIQEGIKYKFDKKIEEEDQREIEALVDNENTQEIPIEGKTIIYKKYLYYYTSSKNGWKYPTLSKDKCKLIDFR